MSWRALEARCWAGRRCSGTAPGCGNWSGLFNERPLIWAVVAVLAASGLAWAGAGSTPELAPAGLRPLRLPAAAGLLPGRSTPCIGEPLEGWGWLAWLWRWLATVCCYALAATPTSGLALRHARNLWLALALLAVQVDYWVGDWTRRTELESGRTTAAGQPCWCGCCRACN